MRQGERGVLRLHPSAPVGFSHAAKNKWLDLPGRHQGRQQKAIFGKHFLPPDIMLRAYGEEAVSSTGQDRTGQGYLALQGTGAQVPQVARAQVWFARAISFTERTAFPATATAYNKSR